MDNISFNKNVNFIICGKQYNVRTQILIYMKIYPLHITLKCSSTKPDVN